jgi:hypothetical protein
MPRPRPASLAGLADTAEALGLPSADAGAASRAVRRWLEADGARCLLVMDNLTDPDLAEPFLPAGGNARVIITTTRRDAEGLGRVVDVAVFTEAEGLAYLAQRTGLADEAGARELGTGLGWLPLALAQAAAVIAGQRLEYAAYLARLRAVPVTEVLAPVPAGQYPHGAAAAILLSLATVTEEDPAGTCARIMGLLAVLSPAGVPRAVILTGIEQAHLPVSPDRPAAPTSATDAALGRLAAASLVSFSLDGSAVIAHRLVQRVVRDQLAGSGRLATECRAAARIISAAASDLADAPNLDRGAARDLVGQATALNDISATLRADAPHGPAVIDTLAWAVYHLNELGDDAVQAITLGELVLADLERALGPTTPTLWPPAATSPSPTGARAAPRRPSP